MIHKMTVATVVQSASFGLRCRYGLISWHAVVAKLLLIVVCGSLGTDECMAQRVREITLEGADWMLYNFGQKKYEETEAIGYNLLYKDIEQPKVLHTLALTLMKLDRKEEAAAYLTLFQRQLLQKGTEEDKKQYMASTERRLKLLSKKHDARIKRRAETAAGREFNDAGSVGELWTTGVVLTPLRPLAGLYANKLFGKRKDAPPDWIHNIDGLVHRSGMKYVREFDGRRGVMFTGGIGKDTRVSISNIGKCRFLRMGVRAYAGGGRQESVKVEVRSGDAQIAEDTFSSLEWADVKFDLDSEDAPITQGEVSVHISKSTPNCEGIWFDYIEFFDN